tara:strand:+ start:15480 stop:15650 length:171 start_codon:yes stop_codon:yes gene_type:complete
MYFIIYKPKEKFISYTNEIFQTEKEAKDYALRSINKKIKWQVVPYDKENYDKYWYK